MKMSDPTAAGQQQLGLSGERAEPKWFRQRRATFVLGSSLALWAAIVLVYSWLA